MKEHKMVTKHLENEATTRAHSRADRYANAQATLAGEQAKSEVMAAYVGDQYGPPYWEALDRADQAFNRAFDLTHGPAWQEEYDRAAPEEWRAVMSEYKASGALADDVVR
jgi:hypothetical protein